VEQETELRQTGLRRRGRKPRQTSTGRLPSLRLFSTLLSSALKMPGKGILSAMALSLIIVKTWPVLNC
jgi:hypothetical protein